MSLGTGEMLLRLPPKDGVGQAELARESPHP